MKLFSFFLLSIFNAHTLIRPTSKRLLFSKQKKKSRVEDLMIVKFSPRAKWEALEGKLENFLLANGRKRSSLTRPSSEPPSTRAVGSSMNRKHKKLSFSLSRFSCAIGGGGGVHVVQLNMVKNGKTSWALFVTVSLTLLLDSRRTRGVSRAAIYGLWRGVCCRPGAFDGD